MMVAPHVALAQHLADILRRPQDISSEQQTMLEELIASCTPEQLQGLGLGPPPPRPVLPKNPHKLAPEERLLAVQQVIWGLQYNHLPGYLHNVVKADRPYNSIMNTAREVLRDGLPIKCIEATFVGLLLTSNWPELERLPVGFKSKCDGEIYRHIVLAVHHLPSGKWGALGISRRPELQYKPLVSDSLADLMQAFKESYEGWGHQLYKIRVGLPTEHDPGYTGTVCWRYCNCSCARHSWERCRQVLNHFADNYRILANRFKVLGFRPPSRGAGGAGTPLPDGTRRVACSGTTPEPGATRPADYRHASPARPRRVAVPEDGGILAGKGGNIPAARGGGAVHTSPRRLRRSNSCIPPTGPSPYKSPVMQKALGPRAASMPLSTTPCLRFSSPTKRERQRAGVCTLKPTVSTDRDGTNALKMFAAAVQHASVLDDGRGDSDDEGSVSDASGPDA